MGRHLMASVLATSCTKPYGGILQVKAVGAGGVGVMEATLQKYPLQFGAKDPLHLTGYYWVCFTFSSYLASFVYGDVPLSCALAPVV